MRPRMSRASNMAQARSDTDHSVIDRNVARPSVMRKRGLPRLAALSDRAAGPGLVPAAICRDDQECMLPASRGPAGAPSQASRLGVPFGRYAPPVHLEPRRSRVDTAPGFHYGGLDSPAAVRPGTCGTCGARGRFDQGNSGRDHIAEESEAAELR